MARLPPDPRGRRALLGAALAGAALAGCNRAPPQPARRAPKALTWTLASAWPEDFPGLGLGPRRLASRINRMSGGRLRVKVLGAGELVPAFEIFDAVADGRAEMGHAAAYYWSGKSPASALFCGVPFGLNAQEMNAWLYHGGGMELWRELYGKFGLIPFPCGNSGTQAAGWFKRELRSPRDLRGLKMRLPGLAGEVLRRLGGEPVDVPAAELVQALEDGRLDAAEWLGPYNDQVAGLWRGARYCYYPGWQEPGTCFELLVNQRAYAALPDDLQAIVEFAAQSVNADMLADYSAANPIALAQLANDHQVEFRQLPDAVLAALKQTSEQLLAELGASDPFSRRVYESYLEFREQSRQWHRLSEQAFYQARG